MQLEYLYAISIVLLACQEIVLLLDTPSSPRSLHSGSVLTWLAADFEISHFREHHTLRTCNIVRFAMSWSWTPWAPGAWCPRPRPATTRPPRHQRCPYRPKGLCALYSECGARARSGFVVVVPWRHGLAITLPPPAPPLPVPHPMSPGPWTISPLATLSLLCSYVEGSRGWAYS